MTEAIKYDNARQEQISRIRKIANNAIIIIWMAGISAILVLTTYFLFFTDDAKADNSRFETLMGSAKLADETMFTDKTTLVNIGLRMQAMPEDIDMASGGTISINKIIHDQKLNKIKKALKKPEPPVKVTKPGFSVKAVPK
ncbi:MAG: hypothetical protein ABI741_08265 [Ferruginibacter sp.]